MKFTLIFIDCKKIVSCFNVFAACEKGKHGFYCEKRCVFPYYGFDCQSQCKCVGEYCHYADGCNHTSEIGILTIEIIIYAV